MKKKFILFLIIIFLAPNIFAKEKSAPAVEGEGENKSQIETQQDSQKDSQDKAPQKSFLQRLDFILQFDPTCYLSPESKENNSNVINIIYPLTIGAAWPNDYFISVQPTLSFFMMEHLWFDKYALPAEIENRTTTTLSFMINIPAVYTLNFKNKSKFQASAGLGAFLRFGILSNGVNKNDPGYSGSAESDVKLINKWFWENAHWLYFTTSVSWLYPITSTIDVGPVINAYIPMGTLFDQKNVQGLMFSVGIKLCR